MFRFVVISCLLALSLGANIHRSRHGLRKLRPVFPSGRIVGGTQTPIEDVPHQVAVEYNGFQFCGGSIINPTTILCAGHCGDGEDADEITIRHGSSKHQSGGTLIQAASWPVHPQYNSGTIDYDVSIIKLAKAITLSPSSQPVQLTDKEPQAGDEVLVSGWGNTQEGGGTPNTLYSVVVPVVDRKECEKDYQNVNTITARMICAGVKGKDSCQGDSGGPVVQGEGDNRRQVGIVSWGVGCAEDGYPGVYTNVADKDIKSFIEKNSN